MNIRELFVSMLVVNAQPQVAGGWFSVSQRSHSRTPAPSSEKLHMASRETPRKDGTTQEEDAPSEMGKWSRGSDQTELQHSPGRGEKCAVIQPQFILWPLVLQGLSSALLECHQFKLTSELLCMHLECSETGIWKHTREHSYQSTKVPSMVCFNEHYSKIKKIKKIKKNPGNVI